jgi:hypothetical protein
LKVPANILPAKIGEILIFVVQMLELYAMKVARTVLRGGKFERTYLSRQCDKKLLKTIW